MDRKEITLNLHSSVLEVKCVTDNVVTLLLSNTNKYGIQLGCRRNVDLIEK